MSATAEASVTATSNDNAKITVYSKKSCVQCNATYKALTNKGIDYEVKMIDEDPEALEALKGMGFLSAPVVVTPTETWSGFRPDLIANLPANPPEVAAA